MSSSEAAPPTEGATPAWAVALPPSLPTCSDCKAGAPLGDGKPGAQLGIYPAGDELVCLYHKNYRDTHHDDPNKIQNFRAVSMDQFNKAFYMKHTADGQRKVADDARRLSAERERFNAVHDLLYLSLQLGLVTDGELHTLNALIDNVKPDMKSKIVKQFIGEIENKLSLQVSDRKLKEVVARDAFVKNLRRTLLNAKVQEIINSDEHRKEQKLEHALDMELVKKIGLNLDYLARHAYENNSTLRLFVKKPVEPGCSQCGDSARLLAARVEARRPKRDAPTYVSNVVGEDVEARKRRHLWLAGSGIEEEPEE